MPDVRETGEGDFIVTGPQARGASTEGSVLVPRSVMLAWVEAWAESKINQYLRGFGGTSV